MKETLSALLDGECSDAELEQVLAELDGDPALRRQFGRQCLTRDARLGVRVRSADLDFSSRVLAALHDEPSVVLPMGSRIRRLPWRTATSLAAAAALGAVAVLVIAPQPAPLAPGPAASLAVAATAEPAQKQFAELDDEHARQMRNYVMAYSRSRGRQGVGSTLGYARYAAYTDAAAPAPRADEPQKP